MLPVGGPVPVGMEIPGAIRSVFSPSSSIIHLHSPSSIHPPSLSLFNTPTFIHPLSPYPLHYPPSPSITHLLPPSSTHSLPTSSITHLYHQSPTFTLIIKSLTFTLPPPSYSTPPPFPPSQSLTSYYSEDGDICDTDHFNPIHCYTPATKQGSWEVIGDRVTELGCNM